MYSLFKDKLQNCSLNYLHNDTSEAEVNVNVLQITAMKKSIKNSATSGKLIIALCTSAVYVYISCTYLSSRLESNSLFVGLGGWGVRGSEQKIWL
jgi:hypothetical protein